MENFKKIFKYPILVLGLHVVATVTGSYWQFSKLDNLMHFLGGASIAAAAMTTLKILGNKKLLTVHSKLIKIIIICGIVALVAVLWEFMEFGIDYFFHVVMQPDLTDTMSDLALGLCGGALTASYLYKEIYGKS